MTESGSPVSLAALVIWRAGQARGELTETRACRRRLGTW